MGGICSGVMVRVTRILCSKVCTGSPALTGEDLVAEGVGGFGPSGVIGVVGEFVASVVLLGMICARFVIVDTF